MVEAEAVGSDACEMTIDEIHGAGAGPPLRGAHCFLGHAFSQDQRDLWQMARRVAEVVSGLPSVSGDDLTGDNAQSQIVEKIAKAARSVFSTSPTTASIHVLKRV